MAGFEAAEAACNDPCVRKLLIVFVCKQLAESKFTRHTVGLILGADVCENSTYLHMHMPTDHMESPKRCLLFMWTLGMCVGRTCSKDYPNQ